MKKSFMWLASVGCSMITVFESARAQQSKTIQMAADECPKSTKADVMVLTQHNDNERTGANLRELCLTTKNLKSGRFGLLHSWKVDGQIYAQPLYVSGVELPDGTVRNVVYVATMRNRIYAFDADGGDNQKPLWCRYLGPPADFDQFPLEFWWTGRFNIYPNIGVTSTPVIDLDTKTIFAVAKVRLGPGKPHKPHLLPGKPYPPETVAQRLYALDLAKGEKHDSVEIAPSVAGAGQESKNGTVRFNPLKELQRAGLLLANGKIYVAFASHQDNKPWHGWIVAYDAKTLKQTAVYCTSCITDSAGEGGIWQAGAGPAADPDGNVYVMTGNGAWDTTTKELANSFVKLDPSLSVIDWFTPSHYRCLNEIDADLGSAGPLLIPNSELLVGGGKEGTIYLLKRTHLGHLQPAAKDTATGYCSGYPINGRNPPVQSFQATRLYDENWRTNPTVRLEEKVRPDIKNWEYHHIHGSPIYWISESQGPAIYIWAERDSLRGFPLDLRAERFLETSPPYTEPHSTFVGSRKAGEGMPGAALSLSANGKIDSTAIIWASLPAKRNALYRLVPGVLRAYPAVPADPSKCRAAKRCVLDELWSSMLGKKKSDFTFAKYASPTVANGRVYLPTFSNKLNVYGLRPQK